MDLEFSKVSINRQVVTAIKVLSATPFDAVQRLVDVVFSAEALSLCKVDLVDHVNLSEDGLMAVHGKVEFICSQFLFIYQKTCLFNHARCVT